VIESIENWRWLLFAMLAAAALSDVRSLKIPNAFPLIIAASSALILLVSGAPASDFGAAALSGLIGLGVGYIFYALGLMGAGDGKLFAAAATWFTTGALLPVSLLVSLAGVAIALILLAARFLRGLNTNVQKGGSLKTAMRTPVPYGVAIALGFIAAGQQLVTG